MDGRAIGVFDSGLGGLTVSRAILELLPAERIIYFGDTARVPYGSKSDAAILRFSDENTRFLLGKNVKGIVVACNTATAIALPRLKQNFSLPILGVVEAGARRAMEVTRNGRIGVIGTVRTIASGAYNAAIHACDARIEVYEKACPLLVPLIEEGWVDHEATRLIVREYLDPLLDSGIDTLILGCTHYPLLADLIRLCYPDIVLVDSASSTAGALKLLLEGQGLLAQSPGTPMPSGVPVPPGPRAAQGITVWVSDYSETFHKIAEEILQSPLDGVIFTVSMEG
jgi:glutamate racemase